MKQDLVPLGQTMPNMNELLDRVERLAFLWYDANVAKPWVAPEEVLDLRMGARVLCVLEIHTQSDQSYRFQRLGYLRMNNQISTIASSSQS